MAGYSGTPLPRKLGVKDSHRVFLDRLPAGLDLGDLGAAEVVRRLPTSADVTVSFHTSSAALAERLPTLFDRTVPDGAVWVCWPKKSAQQARGITSDLDGNRVRDLGLRLGFVDVKVAALNDTWSALKFVRRVEDR